MAKIDRLGWTDGLSFTAYGVRFGVRTNDARVLARVVEHLPPGARPSEAGVVERLYSLRVGGQVSSRARNYHLLYGDLARLSRSHDLDEVMERFESDLQLHVAEFARRRLFVHAGVVGWRGRAIIVPGRSRSGKTTLIKEMVRAGATYYSDEYAVLDEHGRVHPYAKPLSIRRPGENRQEPLAIEEIGGRAGRKPLPIGLVLVTEYNEGARWRPRQCSAGRGALEIMANMVAIRRRPQAALPVLSRALQGAVILKGARGEACEMIGRLLARAEEAFPD